PETVLAGYLDEISGAVARARALVDDVLGYAGARRTVNSRVALNDLLHETAKLLAASYEGRTSVTLILERHPVVLGNAVRLQQVLMNVCNNARAAMEDGGSLEVSTRTIAIATRRRLSHDEVTAGEYVIVGIRDHGRGVTSAAMPHLFDPFFTTRPSGTGLGLSTAWQIVEAHGGTIDVTLPVDGGSLFEIWLPCLGAGQSWPLGRGERVLLLTGGTDVDENEERLADLGFEPMHLRFDELPARFDAALLCSDVLLAIDMPNGLSWCLDRSRRAGVPATAIEGGERGDGHLLAALRNLLEQMGGSSDRERPEVRGPLALA
ncbi:MAG: hypothetical protein EOP19_14385, partial [Hyphomicrobiales bacterium]